MTWVRNRFLVRLSSFVLDVYGLDVIDVEKWESNVFKIVLDILDKLIKGESLFINFFIRVVF